MSFDLRGIGIAAVALHEGRGHLRQVPAQQSEAQKNMRALKRTSPKAQEFQERQSRQLQRWTQESGLANKSSAPHTLAIEYVESELAARGAEFTPVELRLPETLDMDGWAAIGRRLTRADQVMQWWLGDWAAFGLRKFEGVQDDGESPSTNRQSPRPRRGALKEFAESHGINYGTLRNLAWVSMHVELSRRRDTVGWSKHAEVAPLPAKEQDKWLDKVVDENLPVAELRQQIRLSQGENNALKSDGPVTESPRKWLDGFDSCIRRLPDPAGPDLTRFWTAERRAAWKEWLEPVLFFAGRL
jgi:hypothetical protein